jgi:hypothetical protein
MAFCTNCGSNVAGTFCSQCGTAVGAAAQAPPPPAPGAYQPQPVVMGGAPAARKTSPIVWVLVIVLGLVVLGGVAVVGTVAYVAHRARQVVHFDEAGNGGFSIKAKDGDGKDASISFGTSMGKLPSWVPVYPGSSEAKGTFSVKGGDGEGGNFTFTTNDDPARVKTFYADKCKDLGMKTAMETTTGEGSMFVATDEGTEKRSLTVIIGGDSGRTTVNVTYGLK